MNIPTPNLCMIAYILAGGIFYFILGGGKSLGCQDVINSLGTELKAAYKNIVAQRAKNAFYGMFIGLLISYVLMSLYPERFGSCSFLGIALIVTYAYYQFAPKPALFETLLSPENAKKYNEACKSSASGKHWMGMASGLAAYFLVTNYAPSSNWTA
jgi:uncharacterized protein YacL